LAKRGLAGLVTMLPGAARPDERNRMALSRTRLTEAASARRPARGDNGRRL